MEKVLSTAQTRWRHSSVPYGRYHKNEAVISDYPTWFTEVPYGRYQKNEAVISDYPTWFTYATRTDAASEMKKK